MQNLVLTSQENMARLPEEETFSPITKYKYDSVLIDIYAQKKAAEFVTKNVAQPITTMELQKRTVDAYADLEKEVQQHVGHIEEVPRYTDIRDGRLQLGKLAPSGALIEFVKTLKWLACLIEVGVFLAQMIMDGGGPGIVVLAIILAVGSLFFGLGIARQKLREELSQYEDEPSLPDTHSRIFIAGGFLAVAGVIAIRFHYGGWLASGVAFVLAVCIICLEATEKILAGKREFYLKWMYKIQSKFSSIHILGDLDEHTKRKFATFVMSAIEENNYKRHIVRAGQDGQDPSRANVVNF